MKIKNFQLSGMPENIRIKFKKNGTRKFFESVNTKMGNKYWKELYDTINVNKTTFSDWINDKSSVPLEMIYNCMQISGINPSEINNMIVII